MPYYVQVFFWWIDSPKFLRFARSPAFATYLYLVRKIWRRAKRGSRMNLDWWWRHGYLACAEEQADIAEASNVSVRSVRNDIDYLQERGIIRVVKTANGNVYILGRRCYSENKPRKRERLFLEDWLKTNDEKPQAKSCLSDL